MRNPTLSPMADLRASVCREAGGLRDGGEPPR
jgi:hypothetical protein